MSSDLEDEPIRPGDLAILAVCGLAALGLVTLLASVAAAAIWLLLT